MPKKKFAGVVVPLVTPLTRELRLDEEAVRKLFEHLYSAAAFPFILGTTGEAASLPFALKRDYIRIAGQLKKENKPLYVGISSNAVFESIELAEEAFVNGADVVVATLPSYYSLTHREMRAYFLSLAETISGPLMIYNIPATTHQSIPLELVEELSQHPKIVGLKDSERSDERLQESLERWSQREDFSYLSGWAARSAKTLLNGGDGIVPSTGNVDPALYTRLQVSALDGNREEAERQQLLSDQLGAVYQEGRTLGQSLWALKVMLGTHQICAPVVMPPLMNGSEEEQQIIRKNYAAALAAQPQS
jgi:dihydrodipicolinate synthase/N-acetylneuraminate lyase